MMGRFLWYAGAPGHLLPLMQGRCLCGSISMLPLSPYLGLLANTQVSFMQREQ